MEPVNYFNKLKEIEFQIDELVQGNIPADRFPIINAIFEQVLRNIRARTPSKEELLLIREIDSKTIGLQI